MSRRPERPCFRATEVAVHTIAALESRIPLTRAPMAKRPAALASAWPVSRSGRVVISKAALTGAWTGMGCEAPILADVFAMTPSECPRETPGRGGQASVHQSIFPVQVPRGVASCTDPAVGVTLMSVVVSLCGPWRSPPPAGLSNGMLDGLT